ncbi:MAG: hypothetical protein JKY10_08505, partial [Cohaesibacteraceae bacterium]|nr:hypothetical protein [Cohaesibacteraceae bacterium]
PSQYVEAWANYFKTNNQKTGAKTTNLVITDCFDVPQWIFANSIFLNELARKLDSNIASFGFYGRKPKLNYIYRAFGASEHIMVSLSKQQRSRQSKLYTEVMERIQTAQDLFDLRIENIGIGLDIYESILRSGIPTVDLDCYHTKYTIYHGLCHFVFFQDLIRSGKIKAVAPSHDCYLQIGILVKIAQNNKIPVYYANPFEIVKSIKDHDIYSKFQNYPKYFDTLTKTNKQKAITDAKRALNQRLCGTIGVDMPYQIKSAFDSNNTTRQTNRNEEKIKIVIVTHCFFDNPHAFSRMNYRDFNDWLEFLGAISMQTEYEWYIKPHRDHLPGTMEALRLIEHKYPKMKLIDPDTSFHQLRAEGVSIALTCYGSIGHELPILGFKVVNAAYNPHIAYDFNTTFNTRNEYEKTLLNLSELPEVDELESLYKFYAVHHQIVKSNKLMFDDFSDLENFVKGKILDDKCYEFYMQQAKTYTERFQSVCSVYLNHDCQYDFELRLSNWVPEPYSYDTASPPPNVSM